MEQKQSRFFYGWVVVLGCLCIQAAAVGVLSNTLSAFIVPVSTDLGVGRSTFTLYTSFGMVSGLVMAPFWGEFFKNRRFKTFMLVGCAIIAACMWAYSMATNVYHFYAIATIKGVFQGLLTGVPVPRILSNWFIEKRGLAMGVALAGSGLAGSICTPLVTATIGNTGWRSGFQLLTIIFLVITIPVILLLIKEHPSDMGLKPLGWEKQQAKAAAGAGEAEVKVRVSGMTRAQAFKSRTYWCYIAALFLTQCCGMGLQNNVIGHLTDSGFDSMYAARIFSMMMLILVPGKIVLGKVYDTFGMKTGAIIITSLLSVSALLLWASVRKPFPVLFACVFGFANAIQTMQLPYMTGRLFGEREYTRVYGVCQPFVSMGSAIGVPLTAAIRDWTGSYRPAFLAIAVLAIVIMALELIAIKSSPGELEKFDRINDAAAAEVGD
ncbi:MAG: MFS transporter [Clostridia bacterium]|nr:MFS transporter [Clostridia bacterium]